MVAAIVYGLVPPFVPVLTRLGPDMPLSARILIAAYPFAVVLPLATAVAGFFDLRLLVPLAYVLGAAVLVFLLLALYVPMFELS